MQQGYMI